MATVTSREARRRKILDRGSDRLALITGQPRSPPPPANANLDAVAPPCDNVATGYELPKCEPSSASVRDMIDRSASIETFPEREDSNEAVDAMPHNNGEIEPVTGHGSYDQVVKPEPRRGRRQTRQMFTAKRVSCSISASENIRMLCAAFIALQVVLSYHGYPVGGEAIGSIISFRPIFLVLLTDASLVFGILFTTNWEDKYEADAGRTGQESTDWTDQMSKALEVVVVLQEAASAAFLDCCLCAVIIICGISFSMNP